MHRKEGFRPAIQRRNCDQVGSICSGVGEQPFYDIVSVCLNWYSRWRPQCVQTGILGGNSFSSLPGLSHASIHTFAAVVYLGIKTHTKQFVRLSVSKNRVFPKVWIIHLLELLSTPLLARLAISVTASSESDLSLDQNTSHTDLKVVPSGS